MRLDVITLLYGYVLLCLALLAYNLFYIFRSGARQRKQERDVQKWVTEIKKQEARLNAGLEAEPAHWKRMKKKLPRTNALLSYGMALDRLAEAGRAPLNRYLLAGRTTLQFLASHYSKKSSMDRAYFAYLISLHWPREETKALPIMEILLSFLDNSTIYCRENVLNALYALGSCQAVENALELFNDRGWFHHEKLLSDGLLTFAGDREELAKRLWRRRLDWNRNLVLSVVRFISGFSGQYRKRFLPVLEQPDTGLEIRLAILRYYRRYPYEPVRALLLSFLSDVRGEASLSIVAAFVLIRYPGEDTTEALKQALRHPNWYVRYNAAVSLVRFEIPRQNLQEILIGEDRYAKEILVYMLEEGKAGERV